MMRIIYNLNTSVIQVNNTQSISVICLLEKSSFYTHISLDKLRVSRFLHTIILTQKYSENLRECHTVCEECVWSKGKCLGLWSEEPMSCAWKSLRINRGKDRVHRYLHPNH